MLTVVILINGYPIMARSAVNRLAELGCYEVDDGTRVEHDPHDGAAALAIKLLKTIKESPGAGIERSLARTRRFPAMGQPFYEAGCYKCQMGDPHTTHQTADEVYGI